MRAGRCDPLTCTLVSDIDYFAPYPALSESISTHITYLDTIGRPKLTLKYQQLTDKHGGLIYVSGCRILCLPLLIIIPLAGYLQGAVHCALAEARGCCDSVHWLLCSRLRCEACRCPHPPEVIVCHTYSLNIT